LCQENRFEEAEAAARRALELKPDFPNALDNLGNTLSEQGRLEEADAAYRRVLALEPKRVETLINRGFTLAEAGRFDDAETAYLDALRLHPGHPRALYNRALLLLLLGDYAQGWPLYENRWVVFRSSVRTFAQPQWDGRSSLRGQRVLIHAEQGM